MKHASFRTILRSFQAMRGEHPDPAFIADLEFLENRDLDLSVRLGAMLAFNALLITIGTHPVSASPGAPLSLDAKAHLDLVLASLAGVAPFAVSSLLVLRALMIGEEFDSQGLTDAAALRQRLFAAFVRSIDGQTRLLRLAVYWTVAGGIATAAIWAAIIAIKLG